MLRLLVPGERILLMSESEPEGFEMLRVGELQEVALVEE
jgi:hypothetical protein